MAKYKAIVQFNPKGKWANRTKDSLPVEPCEMILIPEKIGYYIIGSSITNYWNLFSDNGDDEPDFHIIMIKELNEEETN